MNRAPAYQYYPGNVETATRHLSDAAFRILNRILNFMWLNADDYSSIPSSPEKISKLLNEPLPRIKSALEEILNPCLPLLQKQNSKLVSMTLLKKHQKCRDFSDRQSKKGKKRAQNSARNEKGAFFAEMRKSSPGSLSPQPRLVGQPASLSPSLDYSLMDGEGPATADLHPSKNFQKRLKTEALKQWKAIKKKVISRKSDARPFFKDQLTFRALNDIGWNKILEAKDPDNYQKDFLDRYLELSQ